MIFVQVVYTEKSGKDFLKSRKVDPPNSGGLGTYVSLIGPQKLYVLGRSYDEYS